MSTTKYQQYAVPSLLVRIVSAVLAAGFIVLGLLSLFASSGWASGYGLVVDDPAGLTYVQAFGARNIALGAIGVFVALRAPRSALVAVYLSLAGLSAIEFFIAIGHAGFGGSVRYLIYAVILVALGVWAGLSHPKAVRSADRPAEVLTRG